MCSRVCSALASTVANAPLDAKTRAIANVYRCKCITRRQAAEPSTAANASLDTKPPKRLLAQMFH